MVLNQYRSCSKCSTNIATHTIDGEFFCNTCYYRKYAHLIDSYIFNLVSEPIYYNIKDPNYD